jgi:hypothetical protein
MILFLDFDGLPYLTSEERASHACAALESDVRGYKHRRFLGAKSLIY